MSPVFMNLLCKFYFMRAAARLLVPLENKLYRQTDGTPKGVPFQFVML